MANVLEGLVLDLTEDEEASQPDWAAAVSEAARRRSELGLSQADLVARMPDAAAINVETYRRFERNEKGVYRRTTLAAISQALGWPSNMLWAVAHGRQIPVIPDDLADIYARIDHLETLVNVLSSAVTRLDLLLQEADPSPGREPPQPE